MPFFTFQLLHTTLKFSIKSLINQRDRLISGLRASPKFTLTMQVISANRKVPGLTNLADQSEFLFDLLNTDKQNSNENPI